MKNNKKGVTEQLEIDKIEPIFDELAMEEEAESDSALDILEEESDEPEFASFLNEVSSGLDATHKIEVEGLKILRKILEKHGVSRADIFSE